MLLIQYWQLEKPATRQQNFNSESSILRRKWGSDSPPIRRLILSGKCTLKRPRILKLQSPASKIITTGGSALETIIFCRIFST